jgi:hypothetical protein
MLTIFLYVSGLLKQGKTELETVQRFCIWSWTVRPEIVGGTVPGTDPKPDPDPEPEPDPDPEPDPSSVPHPGPDPGFPIDPFPRPIPVHVTTIFPCKFD